MKDDVKVGPEEGVYVYGLFLEGASWDRRNHRLTEAKAKVLFEQMPIIHIYAVNSSSTTESKNSPHYVCPIYKKPRRTDLTYIATVQLKCSKTPDHWILRGVALLCDTK